MFSTLVFIALIGFGSFVNSAPASTKTDPSSNPPKESTSTKTKKTSTPKTAEDASTQTPEQSSDTTLAIPASGGKVELEKYCGTIDDVEDKQIISLDGTASRVGHEESKTQVVGQNKSVFSNNIPGVAEAIPAKTKTAATSVESSTTAEESTKTGDNCKDSNPGEKVEVDNFAGTSQVYEDKTIITMDGKTTQVEHDISKTTVAGQNTSVMNSGSFGGGQMTPATCQCNKGVASETSTEANAGAESNDEPIKNEFSALIPDEKVEFETYTGSRQVFQDKTIISNTGNGTQVEIGREISKTDVAGQKTSVTTGGIPGMEGTVVIAIA